MGRPRIGVMGGTFDPIHNGHLVAASEAAAALNLDEVLFVPTGQPWQKTDVSAASDRCTMVEIATAANPKFRVSTVDIDRGGPTFSVDTLLDLQVQHPDSDLVFIIGADAAANIDSWKDSDALLDLAQFVAVTRAGHTVTIPQTKAGSIQVLEIPSLAISSTDIRERVSEGKPIRYLVPDEVLDYIAKHGLYGGEK